MLWQRGYNMNSLPIGSYFVSDSFFHKANAYTKIISLIIIMIAVVNTNSLYGYLLWLLILFICIKLSKIDVESITGSLKKTSSFCLFVFMMNFCFFSKENAYFSFFIFTPSYIGLLQGINVIGKMLILIVYTTIILSSTSPLDLTKGISMLLCPLQYLGLNVYEIAMILSISLTFIPTIYEEAEMIRKAQIIRGAKLDSKNLLTRASSIIPFVVPVFISAFKRADDLSLALISRGIELETNRKIKFDVSLKSCDYYILLLSVLILLLFIF